jgi:hypothetical protein
VPLVPLEYGNAAISLKRDPNTMVILQLIHLHAVRFRPEMLQHQNSLFDIIHHLQNSAALKQNSLKSLACDIH